MTRQLRYAAACVALSLSTAALANEGVLEVLTHAAEVEELSLTAAASQTIFVRRCDECPVLALSVDPATRYFDGSRPVSLDDVATTKRGATVFFDKQSRLVTRIVFWR